MARHVSAINAVRRIGLLVLIGAMLAVSPLTVTAASATVTDVANPDAYTCGRPGYVDFEAYPDGFNLSAGAIAGVHFTTTGGYTWLVGDFSTGKYNGKYPNGSFTSQGTHWAWLGPNQGTGRIDFVNGPASAFSLLTSTGTAVSLDAYSASNALLATAGPSPLNAGTGHMAELAITRDSADMAYVVVHGTANQFIIDAICTDAPGVPHAGNQPPTVTATDPAVTVDEGQTASNTGTVGDPDGDAVTLTASVGTVTNNGDGTWSWSFATIDGPSQSQTVTITADDGKGATAWTSFALTVNNVPPTVGAVSGPSGGVAVGAAVTLSATFTDPGVIDTHTAVWDWGDASSTLGAVAESAGSGSVTGSHTYSAAGVYPVTLTVTDKDGGFATSVFSVVVGDTSSGFVTGGGWLDSPAGADPTDPASAGKATFGFAARYSPGGSTVAGQTEFRVGTLDFQSTDYDAGSLVVSGALARYTGTGTVDGVGGYHFMVEVYDCGAAGACAAGGDGFRIQITDPSTNAVVYDNVPGGSQALTRANTEPIAHGSIVIHSH